MPTATPDDDDVHHEPAAPRRAPGQFGAGAVLAAAVGGIVVGVGLSVVSGPLTGGSGAISPDGDLRTACRYLEAIHPVDPEDVTVDSPLPWRMSAAIDLVTAAERGGAGGDELEAAVTELTGPRTSFDLERFNSALADVMSHCE